MADQTKTDRTRWTLGSVTIMALFHTLGVLVLLIVMVGIAVPLEVAVAAIELAYTTDHIRGLATSGIVIQIGLAVCAWALLYMMFRSIDLGMLARKTPRVVRRARGTVITETLIAMPVFLLILFGMIQLSINNIAGIIHHVASFQAARTVWVWHQEPGVDDAEVEDRVRIAVALTMAPVAAGYYPTAFDDTLSPRAEKTRDFMTDRFEKWDPDFNLPGIDNADLTLPSGLDGDSSSAVRAQRKFTHAYGSTQVTNIIETPSEVGAEVTYQHFQSMPLVGRIFGEPPAGTVGSQNRFYQEYEIRFTLPRQMYGVGRP